MTSKNSFANRACSERMRIAVTGSTGRVGAALANHFSKIHEVIPLPRATFDLTNPESINAVLSDLNCDVFLNPAGITSLEVCEDAPDAARAVNATAPAQIAGWAATRNIKLIHFSTDYVFSGHENATRGEEDQALPRSVYGHTKLAGEKAVLAHARNCVVRVSWVFGPEKPSFVDAVFDNAISGRPLAACADKFSLPTFTPDLARWIQALVDHGTTGLIHACQSGHSASWHDLARVVVAEMRSCGAITTLPHIEALTLDQMKSFKAKRPRFTAMETTRLTEILGQPTRPWEQAVAEHVRWRHSVLQGK